MSISFIRSGSYAIVLAAGLFGHGAVLAAERPAVQPVKSTAPTGQGSSVAISNVNVAADAPVFMIVGAARTKDDAGAATIYGRVAGQFKKIKTFTEATQPHTDFGKSVSMTLNGKLALVGAPGYGAAVGEYDGPGAAFLYKYQGGTWQKVTALTGTDVVGNAGQGEAVFLSPDGTTAFVGGPSDNTRKGAVWVYDLRSGSPVLQAKLVPNDSVGEWGSRFGSAISSSKKGDTVVIGGMTDNGVGAVWVFERKAGQWTQKGAKMPPPGDYRGMGSAVAMTWDGKTFAVSAPQSNTMPYQGAVYVYKNTRGTWSATQTLTDSTPPEYSYLGDSIAIRPDDASTIVFSEPYATVTDELQGRVVTFTKADANSAYTQAGVTPASSCSQLGQSLAISQSADLLFAGSPDTTTSAGVTGATCAYMRQSSGDNPWMMVGSPIFTKN